MTTVTPNRPAASVPPPPKPAGGGATIDPVKLLIKYLPLFIGATVVGVVVGVVAHFALRYSFPIFSSYVTYAVQPATESVTSAQTGPGVEDELQRFMNTEVQYMMSERILGAAANSPKLMNESKSWATKFSKRTRTPDGQTILRVDPGVGLEDLVGRVSARVVPDTAFIRLSAWWYDAKDVAGLVNVIREEYEKDFTFRANLQNNAQQAAIAESIRGYKSQIANVQVQRDRLLQDSGIDSLDQRLNEALHELTLSINAVTDIRRTISATMVAIDEYRKQRESPAGITFDASMRAEVEADPVLVNLKRERGTLESSLVALRERYGSGHRDVQMLESRINGHSQLIDRTRERLLTERFDAREEAYRQGLAQAQKTEADLVQRIEEAKARAAKLTQIQVQVTDHQTHITRLTQSLVQAEDQLKALESVIASGAGIRVTVIEMPKVPTEVTFPKIFLMVPAGVALVLGLVVGVVVLFELVDQRIKGPSDVAIIPRTRVLGMVPHADVSQDGDCTVETVFRDQPRGVLAESVRQLRATTAKRLQTGGYRTLLLTSVLPGSGTTTVATNLALGLAALNQRVLLVDANFRKPRIHSIFALSDSPGLADILAGDSSLESAARETEADHLHILTAGSAANRTFERLASSAMADLLAKASGLYDVVLIDVAPAIVAGDALALASRCDAVALIVRAFQEKRGMVARIRNELSESKAEFLGVVVNAVRPTAGGYMRRNLKVAHEYHNTKND